MVTIFIACLSLLLASLDIGHHRIGRKVNMDSPHVLYFSEL